MDKDNIEIMSGALLLLMENCGKKGMENPRLELVAINELDGSRFRLKFERLDVNELNELTKEIFGNERDKPGKDSGKDEKTGR